MESFVLRGSAKSRKGLVRLSRITRLLLRKDTQFHLKQTVVCVFRKRHKTNLNSYNFMGYQFRSLSYKFAERDFFFLSHPPKRERKKNKTRKYKLLAYSLKL